MRKVMSWKQWKTVLRGDDLEAVRDVAGPLFEDDVLSSRAVFDAIVKWRGGLASGEEARRLIELIYLVSLN